MKKSPLPGLIKKIEDNYAEIRRLNKETTELQEDLDEKRRDLLLASGFLQKFDWVSKECFNEDAYIVEAKVSGKDVNELYYLLGWDNSDMFYFDIYCSCIELDDSVFLDVHEDEGIIQIESGKGSLEDFIEDWQLRVEKTGGVRVKENVSGIRSFIMRWLW